MIRQRWRVAEGTYHSVSDGPNLQARAVMVGAEKTAVQQGDGVWRVLQYQVFESKTSTSGVIGLECGEWSDWMDVPVE